MEGADAELDRLREAAVSAHARGEEARLRFALLETQVLGAEQGEAGLDAAHEAADAELAGCQEAVAAAEQAIATADRERSTWTAKVETLELSLDRQDGAGVLLSAARPGVLGSLSALVTITPGWETAISAALGPLADAVVVEDLPAALSALDYLRQAGAGRATLLVADYPSEAPPGNPAPAPEQGASGVVTTAPALRGVMERLLADVVLVEDVAAARQAAAGPELTAVTRDGEVLAPGRVTGGSTAAPSVLHLQAARDEAAEQAAAATAAGERARFELSAAQDRLLQAQERFDDTLARLHESDAAMAAVAEQLGSLGAATRAAKAEAERHEAMTADASEQREAAAASLVALGQRLELLDGEPADSADAISQATGVQVAAADAAGQARAAETQARLALRTGEERLRATAGRAHSLARAAETEQRARAQAAARAISRAAAAAQARGVQEDAERGLRLIDHSVERAADERAVADEARATGLVALDEVRRRAEALAGTLRDLTDAAHRDEVARAQLLTRLEQAEDRAVHELGTDPGALIDEFGPHLPVPGTSPDDEPTAFVRLEQEERLAKAERALARIGTINPLALEEFSALEERHGYLGEQLGDLKKSRQDLLGIVKDIDERVERVFAEAYADTAQMFGQVFPTLFPGGEGRLVLTDPDDLLTTGIEIEARPAGKKVERLSLLSGGERSLTALAFLVAIFKARPSPFLILDEVEAALDDVNLGRLLQIFRELRAGSQLIVITHQKRTMEVADALYGVTMRGDGVTTVISQRLGDE
ncbi:MAG: AAA family ATPase [Promicromonosporaceae bacterium]|nr:AAA family ATPase [Promicromonosporaceae bacterium]